MLRLKGYQSPRAVVTYGVWVYHRFALSTADVEDLLAERGVTGPLQQISGTSMKSSCRSMAQKMWLWRAVDGRGDVLDILLQPRRNAKAAKRFLKQLMVGSTGQRNIFDMR